jgi:hypothetical protein
MLIAKKYGLESELLKMGYHLEFLVNANKLILSLLQSIIVKNLLFKEYIPKILFKNITSFLLFSQIKI